MSPPNTTTVSMAGTIARAGSSRGTRSACATRVRVPESTSEWTMFSAPASRLTGIATIPALATPKYEATNSRQLTEAIATGSCFATPRSASPRARRLASDSRRA